VSYVQPAHVVLLQPEALPSDPEVFQDLAGPLVRRFRVGLVDLEALHPGVPPREPLRDRVEHDDRLAVARPDEQNAADRIRQVEMAREGPRIGEA
jgi:hypothetical protein